MQAILDASTLLALILQEPGQQEVASSIAAGAGVCTVNLAEVAQRCILVGMPLSDVRSLVVQFPVDVVDVDLDLALRAAELITLTKPFGLSLGDRCCLALAGLRGLPAVTADRSWTKLPTAVDVDIRLTR